MTSYSVLLQETKIQIIKKGDHNRIAFDAATASLGAIHKQLLQNPAWIQARPSVLTQLNRLAAKKKTNIITPKSAKKELKPER